MPPEPTLGAAPAMSMNGPSTNGPSTNGSSTNGTSPSLSSSTPTSSVPRGARPPPANPMTSRPPPKPRAAQRAAQPPPAPTSSRTLKQPMTLRVAESPGATGAGSRSGPGATGAGAGAGAGDAAEYRRALERRAASARRAEKWIDRAMEEVLEREVFLKALTYMHRAQYLEVQHERHLNSLCAYPPCPNPPAAPYRARKRFVVSTAARTITERDGNDELGFCSRKCTARSSYVAQQLGTEAAWLRGAQGEDGRVRLLEEMEERGDVRWGGRRGDLLEWVKPKEQENAQIHPAKEGEAPAATNGQPPTIAQPGPPTPATSPQTAKAPPQAKSPASTTKVPLPPVSGVSSLLASLSIVERATPRATPLPPKANEPSLPVEPGAPVAVSGVPASSSLAPQPMPLAGGKPLPSVLAKAAQPFPDHISQTRPSSSNPATHAQGATLQSSSAAARRREGNSLMSTEHAGLANSVINASKKIPVVESESESEGEEEWAKAMGWGEGPEVDALFAVAREARETLNAGDDGESGQS